MLVAAAAAAAPVSGAVAAVARATAYGLQECASEASKVATPVLSIHKSAQNWLQYFGFASSVL